HHAGNFRHKNQQHHSGKGHGQQNRPGGLLFPKLRLKNRQRYTHTHHQGKPEHSLHHLKTDTTWENSWPTICTSHKSTMITPAKLSIWACSLRSACTRKMLSTATKMPRPAM